MYALKLSSVRSVLCIGAHPDDIEIGCGGTLRTLVNPAAEVRWIVFSGNEIRNAEARSSANCWLGRFKSHRFEICDFEDGFFPCAIEPIKRKFASMSKEFDPEVIFTHHLQDRHQDHKLLAELTWQTYRNHTILEYEIPKYEGDLGHPNVYVPIDEEELNQKISDLMQFHRSQTEKSWFDSELFRGHARIRGAECATRFAEAFHGRKLVVQ